MTIPRTDRERRAWVDRPGLAERLRLTGVASGYALAGVPALLLGILTVAAIPLGLVGVGFLLALAVVPATGALVATHRRRTGALLGTTIEASYEGTSGTAAVLRPLRWLRDPARWWDLRFLWFAATGGFVLSLLPLALLCLPVVWTILALTVEPWFWLLPTLLGAPALMLWWRATPSLVRTRLLTERGLLDHTEAERLRRRIEQVEKSRSATLDHGAAEVRRIERDLHDGAQARIAAVGMNVGLAEKLVHTDPEAAAALLREARETTVGALEDLRSVVRGIHPPVLADRGLAGGIEALALALPLPVTVSADLPRLPAPVESAAYFAVAELLANTAKHAGASHACVRATHDGEALWLTVSDDGRGGADPAGSGLTGIERRLAAFDGTIGVDSPPGGPTVVTLELPCRQS